MKPILPLIMLLFAGAGQAATTPAKPAAAPAASPPPASKRFPGVSDAGNAILAKAQGTPDPQLQALAKQQRAAHDLLTTAVMAPVIDVEKVTTALRQQEAVQTQIRTHNNDRLIAVLKQLPEEDRGTFLRTLVMAKAARPAS
ncbi:MAG TPA: hypothetical protein VNT42_04365 [Sphingomonas sp.]|nr:hypothetical protein [Sphingomonas sp.]